MGTFAKILVIDDDPDIGIMVKMMLEYKGYTVTVLESPEHVKKLLRSGSIDVVIMDMFLSGFNGIDVCTSIKKDAAIAHIPLIMMSAHPDAKKICIAAGADDFVSKPFDLSDLLLKINHFMNQGFST